MHDFQPTHLPAIRPAARLRRTSVFAAGENLGAGAIHCAAVGSFAALQMRRTPCGCLPRAFEIPKGGGRLQRPEPKKKDMTYGHVFLFGAGGRTRTGTVSPPVDFESTTSTNSITPAKKRSGGYYTRLGSAWQALRWEFMQNLRVLRCTEGTISPEDVV